MTIKRRLIAALFLALLVTGSLLTSPANGAGGSNYAHSDGNARFLHHIHLYDAADQRIDPESTTPYSSVKTCGRCHDYNAISHGWHFNAFMQEAGKKSSTGREGEPWIWTDPRTGTQLPLSYRGGKQTFDPGDLGIDNWAMTKQFGGRLPGGPMGMAPEATEEESAEDSNEGEADAEAKGEEKTSRWPLTGSLEIDCMACHGVASSYDFNLRREHIAKENFAWAATAALHIGEVDGDVSRLKDGSDPTDEAIQKKMPKVTYDGRKFAADGTVFMDLVRAPDNNSCYQCHSQRTLDSHGIESRWTHDQDVHLRAGMKCVDCHRNGLDHHTVRGFAGEVHPSGQSMTSLSCAGCHLGTEFANHYGPAQTETDAEEGHSHSNSGEFASLDQLPGRLGSPMPGHAGLPALHFEKLSCTACHAGPIPRDEALGMMTSLAHSLGEKAHRSGAELPRIQGPVFSKGHDGKVYPHRVVWPAYWATVVDDKLQPLAPEQVYDITRRSLRVRNDFIEEILEPKLKSSDLKELLGEDRYKTDPEEYTDEEAAKVNEAVQKAGKAEFDEKVYAALKAIEKETGAGQAVYVSAGFVYAAGDEEDTVKTIEVKDTEAIDMVQWPIAHNVRPAGWALGANGCVECHQDNGKLFASTVTPTGPGPDDGEAVTMASLQGIDADQRLTWNQLFQNRASFKYVIGGSIVLLVIAIVLALGILLGRIGLKTSAPTS
ncbi:cytochrome c3 family protein [Rhodopirellula sp. MGV]|uniref:cytochrome c3 family protein n=1 Tax=Rhodopirellula sp. MGV TaxID=2023130 RepID=UPI00130447F7|nr:cytochrome c3 family protein [Rhodopirellula sp. MGV]